MDTERRSGWIHSGLVIIGLLMLGGLLAVLSDVTINLKSDTAPRANPSALRESAARGEYGTGHSDTPPGANPSALDPAPTRTRQYDFGSLGSPMPHAPPQRMVMTGNMLYFMTWTPGSGDELWKSDGSASGTVRVKALNPGARSIFPASLTSANGKIFFITCDDFTSDSQRYGLWVSDGTEGGTVRLKDFTTGPDRLSPTSLISVGGDLFFSAYDRAGGTELWTSDGTESGTVRVSDINPGTESAQPAQLTDVNGRLFFTAYNGASGTELWTSDGTEGGTVLVKDISPSWSRAQPTQLTNVNGRLFFFADDGVNGIEQWTSDGSERGTIRLKDITPREAGADYAAFSHVSGILSPFTVSDVNGDRFFLAVDDASDIGLWTSNGSTNGTARLKSIPRDLTGMPLSPLIMVNTMVFFAANDPASGRELWRSDGTEAGTVQVKDISPDVGSTNPTSLTNVGGTLYFINNAFVGEREAIVDGIVSGTELWKSDGTAAGTVRVKDLGTNRDVSNRIRSLSDLTNVNGKLFFIVNDNENSQQLWMSDGSEGGTVRVMDLDPGLRTALLDNMTPVNGMLFFTAYDGAGQELWRSDGTVAGTVRVKDINPGSEGSYPANLTAMNGALFFTAAAGTSGREQWTSDGTEASTVRAKTIDSGVQDATPSGQTRVGEALFFTSYVANGDKGGWVLWKSAGPAASAVRVKDLATSSPANLIGVNDRLFFTISHNAPGEESHQELWRSDGTEAGTVQVQARNQSADQWVMLQNLTDVNGTLFFSVLADDGQASTNELWRSDGTPGGTVRLKEGNPDFTHSNLRSFTNVNGTLFFAIDRPDQLHTTQLWKSDGSAAGTVPIQVFPPVPPSATPPGAILR